MILSICEFAIDSIYKSEAEFDASGSFVYAFQSSFGKGAELYRLSHSSKRALDLVRSRLYEKVSVTSSGHSSVNDLNILELQKLCRNFIIQRDLPFSTIEAFEFRQIITYAQPLLLGDSMFQSATALRTHIIKDS